MIDLNERRRQQTLFNACLSTIKAQVVSDGATQNLNAMKHLIEQAFLAKQLQLQYAVTLINQQYLTLTSINDPKHPKKLIDVAIINNHKTVIGYRSLTADPCIPYWEKASLLLLTLGIPAAQGETPGTLTIDGKTTPEDFIDNGKNSAYVALVHEMFRQHQQIIMPHAGFAPAAVI